MDRNYNNPNLFNRDSFHPVEEIKDKRKENTGYMVLAGKRAHVEHKQQWAKSHTFWGPTRRGYTQNAVPEITREFRVVRDNRMKLNNTKDIMPGSPQNSSKDHQIERTTNVRNLRSSRNLIDLEHSAQENSDGCSLCQHLNGRCDSIPAHAKYEKSSWSESSDKSSVPKEKQMSVSNSRGMAAKELNNKSQTHPVACASSNCVIGVYSSSSHLVHVPSSRSSGSVGSSRHELGPVGVRQKSTADHSVTFTSKLGNSSSVPLSERDDSFSRDNATTLKRNQPYRSYAFKPFIPSMSIRKSSSSSQSDVKPHYQVMGYQKAVRTNMKWKPKSSLKLDVDSSDATNHSSQEPISGLSERLLQVNISKNEHVIIPEHLRVSESERAGLVFGSFGADSVSIKSIPLASKAFKDAKESSYFPSSSTSAEDPDGFGDSLADQSGPVDSYFRNSSSDISASAAEPTVPINDEPIRPRDIESYPDIGLIQSRSPPCSSCEPLQNTPPNLADFSAYDPRMNAGVPFSRKIMEGSAQAHGFSLAPEALNTHVTDDSSFSNMSMVQQPQHFTQLYPQVHIAHYPKFSPYRQIISPLYVPQMLVPNYSRGSAPTDPSGGGNYLMMPGENPQSTSGSLKYGPSQYKTIQAGNLTSGYGIYTNSCGYSVSTVGSTAGIEHMTGMNFKDNNVYVPNPQSDVDIWTQNPSDLASLRPAPPYNLSGQAQAHQTYLPAAHGVNPALNPLSFPSPHLQYQNLYYHPQQGAIAAQTNPIVHQREVHPGWAGNSGIGIVPAASAQVGAYQQSQLEHLHWTNSF
ncbi:uncharacterized protein LOC109833582 isoform X2 [Asparagus officinalis]|uniref:uncharacterized protein LOC109833582 isoform X2 n=2 Tax=Asparagus officinalis TaxID=4686 RepID=UPI00098E1600|nr:uncharacterized protein LOC109833582 isoform X2 [Asparagus officinalis]